MWSYRTNVINNLVFMQVSLSRNVTSTWDVISARGLVIETQCCNFPQSLQADVRMVSN